MKRTLLAATLLLTAGAAVAQSGCQAVSADLDAYLRGQGAVEAAERLSVLDTAFILQFYTDMAREAAESLERGRPINAADVTALDNLTGVIDCFVGDQDQDILINGYATPFSERFFEATRLALLDALYARDAQAPVLQCVRGGQC